MGFDWTGVANAIIGTAASHWSAKQNAKIEKDVWRFKQQNAHQFEVEDLRAAGLNPILSATNGQIAGSSSVTDSGVGSNVTSALSDAMKVKAQKEIALLDAEIRNRDADTDAKEAETNATNAATQQFRADTERYSALSDANYKSGLLNIEQANSASNIETNNARIKQINQDIANSISLTHAQVSNLYSGATLNYATAKKVGAEIGKILAETTNINLDSQQITRILTDPRAEIERQEFARALEGQNLLGFAVKLGMYGKEFGSLFPSRVGVGLSRR